MGRTRANVTFFTREIKKKKRRKPKSFANFLKMFVCVFFFSIYSMDIYSWDEWAATVNGTEKGMMVELLKANIDIGGSPCSANSRYAPYGHISAPGYPYRCVQLKKLRFSSLIYLFAANQWNILMTRNTWRRSLKENWKRLMPGWQFSGKNSRLKK